MKDLPREIHKIIGNKPGPTVTILGGTHGNEHAGIAIIKKLRQFFDIEKKPVGQYKRNIVGTIYLGLGNPAAIKKDKRGAGKIFDLNRSFDPKKIDASPTASDSLDLKRARELAPILAKTDYLVDIHGTSSPSEPFLVTTDTDIKKLKELTKHIHTKHILLDPHNVYTKKLGLSVNGSTDSYVNLHGRIGICYETGQRTDMTCIDNVYHEILHILARYNKTQFVPQSNKIYKKQVYHLSQAVTATNSDFTYSPGMDIGWSKVHKGKLIGTYKNKKEERAQKSGIILFQKPAKQVKKGTILYYIADLVQTLKIR